MAGCSDLDRQIEQLRRCEYIKEAEVKALCAKAREILVEESNVQRVDAPVTVRCAGAAVHWPANRGATVQGRSDAGRSGRRFVWWACVSAAAAIDCLTSEGRRWAGAIVGRCLVSLVRVGQRAA